MEKINCSVYEYSTNCYADDSLQGKLDCLDRLIDYCREQQTVSSKRHYWVTQEDTLQLIKQDVSRANRSD